MKLGQAIREKRKEKKITQRDLAKKMRITNAYLSQLEQGKKKVSGDLLEASSKALDIPIPMLIWYAVEEHDIKPERREMYNNLKESIDLIIKSIS